MATLWEIITSNSALPVEQGNDFWAHLNNQSGGGDIFIGAVLTAEIFDQTSASINESATAQTMTETLTANIDNELSMVMNETNEANLCQ